MIQKFSKEQIERLGLNARYLSSSAMQKAIRRGDSLRAVNFAKVLWQYDPYKFFYRLWTVLYEDCGRDPEILLAFYRYRDGYKEFEKLIPLVVGLATAKKSREAAYLSFWFKKDDLHENEPWDQEVFNREIMPQHWGADMLAVISGFPTRKMDAYGLWDFGVGPENYDWTLELAERAAKFDNSKMCYGSPFFFFKKTIELDAPVRDECDGLTLLQDWMPSEAIDQHTRPGKMAIGTYMKHTPDHEIPGVTYQLRGGLGEYVFFHEGQKYKNLQEWTKANLRDIYLRMMKCPGMANAYEAIFSSQAVIAMTQDVIPELHKVREWVMRKSSFRMDFEMLKQLYESNWIMP